MTLEIWLLSFAICSIVILDKRNKHFSNRKENENPDSGIYRGRLKVYKIY